MSGSSPNSPAPRRTLGPRAALLGAVSLYTAVFWWTYCVILHDLCGYWGFGIRELSADRWLLLLAFALVPALWAPTHFDRPSVWFFYLQYLILYIPGVFIAHHCDRPELDYDDVLRLCGAMFAGISILSLPYVCPLLRLERRTLSPGTMRLVLGSAAGIAAVLVFASFGANFRFGSLDSMYDVRFRTAELASESGLVLDRYAGNWLVSFLLPLGFATAMFNRRRGWAAAAILSYFVVFGVLGSKTTLFAFAYLPGIYWLVTRVRRHIGAILAVALAGVVAAGALLYYVAPDSVSGIYIFVVNFRTFGVPQILLPQYYSFFSDNPQTYFSHVSLLRPFVDYPYTEPVGVLIGQWLVGGAGFNANASAWAGDGLAALGAPGIPVMSLLVAFTWWLIDSLARALKPAYVIACLAFMSVNVLELSFFTMFLTGGLVFFLLFLYYCPDGGLFASGFRPRVCAEGAAR